MFNINAFCSSLTSLLPGIYTYFPSPDYENLPDFFFNNFVFMIFQVKRHW